MASKVLKGLLEKADEVYKTIIKKKQPRLDMPLRSLTNVEYDPKKGYFELLGKTKDRTLTAATVKTFAQTLKMMALSKELIQSDDIATKREAYYVSKNWGEARFNEQPESLSSEEDIVVRLNEEIRIMPAKEIVAYSFKSGRVIENRKKVSVENLDMYCLSFDNNLKIKEHKIKYVHKHPPRPLIKIVSSSGREVCITPFHSLFSMNKNGVIESKSASRLTNQDYIAIPKKISIDVNNGNINLLDQLIKTNKKGIYLYIDKPYVYDNFIKSLDKNALRKFVKEKYKNNLKNVLYQWRIHQSIPLALIKHSNNKDKHIKKYFSIGYSSGKTKFNVEIKKNYHLGYVLGLLLSEGTNFIPTRNKNERQVKLSNNSKKIMLNFIHSFNKLFGQKSLNNEPVQDENGTYILRVGYQLLSLILEKVFEYKAGTKSWDKKVPSLLFNAPEGCINGFIKGFWQGDGSTNYNFYRIHSTSRELIEGINLLLLRRGIFCKIYECKKIKEHHHKPYEIKIANLDSVRIFKKIVGDKDLNNLVKSTFSGDRIPNIGYVINEVRKSCTKRLPHSVIKMLDWYSMQKRNSSISVPTLQKILNIFTKYVPTSPYFNLLKKYINGDIYWDRVKDIQIIPKQAYTMDFTVNPSQNFIGGKGLVILHNSDTVMDDIEAMMMVNREQIGFIPEEKGGDIAGSLIVIDKDPDTGKEIKIDCTKFGSGAYSIPSSVEELKFETKAKFILAIETAGMFQRLVKHNYWKKANCILISMGGVPTRACRRFIRRLSDDMKLPVYAFCDGDPYAIGSIFRTLKVGSGNAAHINEFFCVPRAKFLGVTPQDIIDYKLPTHPLLEVDHKKIKDLLKNDPFIKHYKDWQKALKQMADMKVRCEQQSLAAHGLNYVISNYLPEKLKYPEKFLP